MSSKVYCIAEFRAKGGFEQELLETLRALEPQTLREDGCLQYRLTRQIHSPFADGTGFHIVFNEIWQDMDAFETHCQKPYITKFFQEACIADTGIVAEWNVRVFSDEF